MNEQDFVTAKVLRSYSWASPFPTTLGQLLSLKQDGECSHLNVNMSNVTMTRLSSEGQDINTYLDGTLPFVFVSMSTEEYWDVHWFTLLWRLYYDCGLTSRWIRHCSISTFIHLRIILPRTSHNCWEITIQFNTNKMVSCFLILY